MTISNNNFTNTARDEEIARALEASFRAQEAAIRAARPRRPQPMTSRSDSDGTWPHPSAVILPSISSSADTIPTRTTPLPPPPTAPLTSRSKIHKRTSSVDAIVADARKASMLARQALALEHTQLPASSSSSSPSKDVALAPKSTSVTTTSSSTSSSPTASRRSSPSPSRDEELARRLAQELNDEELARELRDAEMAANLALKDELYQQQQQQQQRSGRHRTQPPQDDPFAVNIPPTIIVGGGGRGETHSAMDDLTLYQGESPPRQYPSTDGDEALARRLSRQLEQEQYQPPTLSPHGGGAAAAGGGAAGPKSCRSKTMYYGTRLILALMAVGITLVVWLTLFGKNSGLPEVLDPATWMPGFPEEDPFVGMVGDHSRWVPTGRSGLSLPILNNLVEGSDWAEYLEVTVSDWDNGTPDAVSLRIRGMEEYDPDCQAVRMAIKVCNGDYGPTDWRGVNQVLLQDEYIITSIAKMNDYYLEGTDGAQKHYTMCHELGHGLGLGHSDENFLNADSGNCMDYTNSPQNNLMPDEYNYLILEDLYGLVEQSEELQEGGDALMTTEQFDEMPVDDDDDDEDDRGDRSNRREEEEERTLEEIEFETYAAYLLDPIEVSLPSSINNDGGRWRVLHESEHAVHHERDLGNGYTIRTSFLLAREIKQSTSL